MNQYIKKLRILDENGVAQDKQIDYNALANLPESLPANGGHANTAFSADTANHAVAADSANYAENANTANTANFANFADQAGRASIADQAYLDANGNAFVDTYATKEDLANEVANLVDSAPGALDTLNELAQALGNDPNFATTVLETLGNKENKSVYQKTMIYSENWDENQYYSFEDLYPSAQWDFEIFLDGQQTTEEIKESYNDAEIIGGYNENKIKAFGVIPTIDIPIIIKAVEK